MSRLQLAAVGSRHRNLQDEVHQRLHDIVCRSRPEGYDVPSPEGALCEILRGRASYSGVSEPVALASYNDGIVSLPTTVADAPDITSVVDTEARWYLEDVERMELEASAAAKLLAETSVEPHVDRVLLGSSGGRELRRSGCGP